MKHPLMRLSAAFGLAAALLAAGCATAPGPTDAPAPGPHAAASAPAAAQPELTSKPSEAALKALEPAASAPAGAADAAVIVADPEATPASATSPLQTPESEQIAQSDLWDRIRRGFAMPDLEGDLVRNREQYYASRPDYMQRMTERASRYLFHIVEEVEYRGMPTELALLPFIESAFNPQAMSVAKASGMWQFIPSTGKHFDLTQNIFRDERRDVLASTRAALDYLGKLYGMFGDWHLALAAYNWGEGSVQRAIARNKKAGRPTDYASLRMPAETRYYVPKLQAVKNIVGNPESFGLSLSAIENHPYFLTVAIQRDMDVDVAVELAGLHKDEFRALNPQMNKPVILAAGTPQILLPYDNARRFIRNLGDHQGPLASWTAWVVPSTMKAADAAERVGMTESELREVNKIPPRMLIRAGSTLLVPRSETQHAQDVSAEVADNAVMSLAPEASAGRRVVVRARSRESVTSLARRIGVRAADLALWNGVSPSARFASGQRVVVYRAVKGKRSTAVAKSGGKNAKGSTRTASKKKAGTRTASRHNGKDSTKRAAAKTRVNVAKTQN
ncbi:transglycosylase SLT domain-containing protein [Schlegelella sp. S2-27]|uniref:Transglycosylase SLT domain-containing protein n=2 Tax=Caldimonas mangrovi TaxID=2944811 RepID=A0ABT0YQQ6_9BURK|nr:transglycosylase SLT domain-containing protein [Caldimonas mangrovi]MCM5680968.1 transglycosylase SLT domain-containing protein [Caldimonas mangrovi]